MTRLNRTILAERLGMRVFYVFITNLVKDRLLPPAKEANSAKGWAEHDIRERIESARYFGRAQVVRALCNIPMIYVGWKGNAPWVLYSFLALLAVQILMIGVEVYKHAITSLLTADPDATPEPPPNSFGDWYFTPKKWESEKFYRAIGIEGFRTFVNWYISSTRLTREEKTTGKKVEYVAKPAPNDLLRFEVGTRIGEIVHLIIALINIMPLVVAIQQYFHGYIIFHCAFFVWGDFYLVLLQRYHRLRIWQTAQKLRERIARKEKRKEVTA